MSLIGLIFKHNDPHGPMYVSCSSYSTVLARCVSFGPFYENLQAKNISIETSHTHCNSKT